MQSSHGVVDIKSRSVTLFEVYEANPSGGMVLILQSWFILEFASILMDYFAAKNEDRRQKKQGCLTPCLRQHVPNGHTRHGQVANACCSLHYRLSISWSCSLSRQLSSLWSCSSSCQYGKSLVAALYSGHNMCRFLLAWRCLDGLFCISYGKLESSKILAEIVCHIVRSFHVQINDVELTQDSVYSWLYRELPKGL